MRQAIIWINMNIERHTAHTTLSWPNPKQRVIVHTSDLMTIIRQSIYILSIITQKMGELKTHSPTYCIMDNRENMLNLTHTRQIISDRHFICSMSSDKVCTMMIMIWCNVQSNEWRINKIQLHWYLENWKKKICPTMYYPIPWIAQQIIFNCYLILATKLFTIQWVKTDEIISVNVYRPAYDISAVAALYCFTWS